MPATAVVRKSISEAEARRAYRVLQAVWVIASAMQTDAIATDVEELGEALKKTIDEANWQAAKLAVDDCRRWMSTMAGVVTSRMTRTFDL